MAKFKRKLWTLEDDAVLTEKVTEYVAKGKSISSAIRAASKLLKRTASSVYQRHWSLENKGKNKPAKKAKKFPHTVLAGRKQQTVEVKGNKFGFAAHLALGTLSVSDEQIALVFNDDNTTIQLTQSKDGIIISKA